MTGAFENRIGDPLQTVAQYLNDRSLVHLASASKGLKNRLSNIVKAQKMADIMRREKLIEWRRVLESNTWYALCNAEDGQIFVEVTDHQNERKHSVTVELKKRSFTFGELALVVGHALRGSVDTVLYPGSEIVSEHNTKTRIQALVEVFEHLNEQIEYIYSNSEVARKKIYYNRLTPSRRVRYGTMHSIDNIKLGFVSYMI